MHITRTAIATADPFLLAIVKLHSRVAHDDEDAILALMARAAAFEIERHAELALLAQVVTVTFPSWCSRMTLPIGPLWSAGLVDHPVTVELIDGDGAVSIVTGWRIEGGHHPVLTLTETIAGQALRISYPAGYGLNATSIPDDLQHAINDQASCSYDMRGAEEGAPGLSLAATRIAARYRRVALA